MDYNCKLIEQSGQSALSVRARTTVGNLPQVLGKAYASIMQYLGEIGEQPSGPPFVAYYNMDMQDLDVEIGFPVSRPLSGKNEIEQSEIPAGRQAVCLHTGPYNQVEPAYGALTKWIAENEYVPTGVAYEFYLNDPGKTPESQLQTRIAFPLK